MRRGKFKQSLKEARHRRNAMGEVKRELKAVVIPEARAIYFAVPKAANSSAKLALCPTLGIDTAAIRTQQDIHSELIPTLPAAEAVAMAGPDWFTFTIVRHPVDRAYSAWRDKLDRAETPFRPLAHMGLERGDSFETFLKVLQAWPVDQLNDHFMPQHRLLADALTLPDLRMVRMEDIGTEWALISDELERRGARRPDAIPHVNRSGPVHRPELSRTALWRIYRLYWRDFGTLGYPVFGPGTGRRRGAAMA